MRCRLGLVDLRTLELVSWSEGLKGLWLDSLDPCIVVVCPAADGCRSFIPSLDRGFALSNMYGNPSHDQRFAANFQVPILRRHLPLLNPGLVCL